MIQPFATPNAAEAQTACITGARQCRDEYPRQLAHLLLGVVSGILILVLPPHLPAVILACALLVAFVISDALAGGVTGDSRGARFLGTFVRSSESPGGGANYTGLSVLAALLLFPATAAAAAAIAFGVLDSVSTIGGLRYGHRRLWNGKSLEGATAAFACAAVPLLLFVSPAAAVAVAAVAALAELVLPVNDNLIVPFLIALLVAAVP